MFLTWVEEKQEDVILVATANNIATLPPELLSRLSVAFWVDLPDSIQRLEIIKIHVKKAMARSNWGKSLKISDLFSDEKLAEVVSKTREFSGRELEAAVKDALARAWAKKHSKLMLDDLLDAVGAISPTAKVKKAELDVLREKAKNQGMKPASIVHAEPEAAPQAQGSRRINTGGGAPIQPGTGS